MTVTAQHAEDVAVRALLWLAADDERMGGFLGATGADVADIRKDAQNPAFLGAVLDYILAADESVLEFAATESMAPDMVAICRQALPGGAQLHWT